MLQTRSKAVQASTVSPFLCPVRWERGSRGDRIKGSFPLAGKVGYGGDPEIRTPNPPPDDGANRRVQERPRHQFATLPLAPSGATIYLVHLRLHRLSQLVHTLRLQVDAPKKCYIVTWNLSSDETRARLVDALKALGQYCPIHRNAWAIKSSNTAAKLRDHLIQFVGAGDSIFVVRSGTEAAWRKSYGEKNDKWLQDNL
ncbi:MAG: hypothetical protein HONBIEJF_01039 [Fimbriimonadaceae bacterium]|nr:hypothetical protein [Fimbriimonadaceae bacterium]